MKRRWIKPFLAGMAAVFGLFLLMDYIPCKKSREAIGSEQTEIAFSCGEKAIRFCLVRHRDLQRMSDKALQGETDPERRVLNLLAWTRKMVRPVPPGFPVIDDHIPYTVLRGYGADYQMAEVFTTLAFYAGHEARWTPYTPPGGSQQLMLSFVDSGQGWWIFDVRNGGWFETDSGRIATIEDFQQPERLHRRGAAPEKLAETPYVNYFRDLDSVWKGAWSRARGQSCWDRLLIEIGLEPA